MIKILISFLAFCSYFYFLQTAIAMDKDEEEMYDYIIVGAGSAGATLAGRLYWGLKDIEKPARILLLEAGPDDGGRETEPFDDAPSLTQTQFNWADVTVPQPYMNNRTLNYNSGKVNGGGSAMNGMLEAWGHCKDYCEWARLAGDETGEGRWGPKNVFRILKNLECYENGNGTDCKRGYNGEVGVSKIITELGRRFIGTTGSYGYNSNEDYVADLKRGISYPQFEAKKCERNSEKYCRQDAFTCFVKPILEQEKRERELQDRLLRVRNHARMKKVNLMKTERKDEYGDDEFEAISIEYLWGEECPKSENEEEKVRKARIREGGEVILCTGAIRTPQILMLSGIGDYEHTCKGCEDSCKRSDDDPCIPLKKVGKNFSDHISTPIVRKFNKEKYEEALQREGRSDPFLLKQLENDRVADSTKSSAYIANTNFVLFLNDLNGKGEAADDGRPSFEVQSYMVPKGGQNDTALFGVSVMQLRPSSTGNIELLSCYYLDQPKINPNFFSVSQDIENQKKAVKEARELLDKFAAGDGREWLGEEVFPGERVIKDEDIIAYIPLLNESV